MKILESMLKKWVDIDDQILEITNQKIIEVDAFEPVNTSTKLVIGHVLTCEKHPNADTLSVTTVDVGKEVLQIVCGAPNVKEGQTVIVAQEGSVLPDDFVIKKTKIRGIESCGMICSLKELGISGSFINKEFQEGIFYFDKKLEIGSPALPHLGQDGFLMTLGLTPNRADLLSVLGFAYDYAQMTNQIVKIPRFNIHEISEKNDTKVLIQTEGCGRYYLRKFKDVVIKDSPWWLKSALLASDIQPINNVVDISNYVMLEYGTPLHMFDAVKVNSNKIVIRDAKPKETVRTLDDETRILDTSDVLITDGKDAIAIGGIMGLERSMITIDTKEVLLEAAYFDPKRIQKTSKRLNLRSDSSIRFERGIDEERVILGLERATELLIELASAKVYQGINEHIFIKNVNPEIKLSLSFINKALGTQIPENEIDQIFNQYRYNVRKDVLKTDQLDDIIYFVTAPTDRRDINIDADILEEIARMYGLNKIPTKPIMQPLNGHLSFAQKRLRDIRHHLAEIGLNEVITYSLLKEKDAIRFGNKDQALSLLLPLSEDRTTLRQSLIPGLLEAVSYNQSRQIENTLFFEIGNCYQKDNESLHLGIALSGEWIDYTWKNNKAPVDFYLLKGIMFRLFDRYNITFNYQEINDFDDFHPFMQASILHNHEVIGRIAKVHPKEAKRLNIKDTYVCEIKMDHLLKVVNQTIFKPISKFPSVTRDLAIIVDENIKAQELMNLIQETTKKYLVSIQIFDIYQGSNIKEGKKSIAFSMMFNDATKTLSSEEADKLMKKVFNRLTTSFDAVIRN